VYQYPQKKLIKTLESKIISFLFYFNHQSSNVILKITWTDLVYPKYEFCLLQKMFPICRSIKWICLSMPKDSLSWQVYQNTKSIFSILKLDSECMDIIVQFRCATISSKPNSRLLRNPLSDCSTAIVSSYARYSLALRLMRQVKKLAKTFGLTKRISFQKIPNSLISSGMNKIM